MANARAESHSPDVYHPKGLWNHSLCAQHRQGGDKRAGTRDCKLSSPLLSEDKNDLPPQDVATDQPTDRSDLFHVTQKPCQDNFSVVSWQPPLSPGKNKTKFAQKTNPVNKHDLLSIKTKSTRIRNGHHSTKSKFETCLLLSKDCGFIS